MADILTDDQNQIVEKTIRRRDFKRPISLARNADALIDIDVQIHQITKDLELSLDAEKIVQSQNQDNLEAIIDKKNVVDRDSFVAGLSSALISLVFSSGFSAILLPLDYGAFKLLEKAQRLQQVKVFMCHLMDKFKDEGVEVFPDLAINDLGCIDLFIRFPTRYFFIISCQFIGKNTLFYSKKAAIEHQRDGLYLRGHGGRRKKFKLEKLNLLLVQERHLRQQYKDILGGSNKDTKSPIIKILAISGKDAKMTNNFPSWLTEKNESRNYYLAQKSPSIFVMLEQEIIDFVEMKIKVRRF